jgi:uncharacterized RDD family membrane protein YckC
MQTPSPTPGILRRLASMLYEILLLASVLFVAGFLFLGIAHDTQSPVVRKIFQAYLLAVIGGYFLWFWLHGGQTLPMKTWRLRLVSADGKPLTPRQAIVRFLCALIGVSLGFGILWALFDRDRQFWHDRMAGTKIIEAANSPQ